MKLPMDSYKGVIVPMVTPLNAEGKIDEDSSLKLINFLLDNKTNPFALGTTGEAASIPVEEREKLINILVANKRKEVPAMAGVIGLTFAETVSQANSYIYLGVDSVVITIPNYYELTDLQIFNYYRSLSERIEGDILIYNIPKTIHQSIPVKVIDELSHIPNIIGVKDSEMNEQRLMQSLSLWKNRDDFFHYTGVNALMPIGIELGSKGIVPGTGNIVPSLYVDLYLACMQNKKEETDKIFRKSVNLSNLYQEGNSLGESLAALKYVLSEMDLCKPYVMPPLSELSAEEKKRISEEMKKLM